MPDPDAFLDPFVVAAVIGGRTDLPICLCVTDTVRRKGIDLFRAAMTLHDVCNGGFILGVGSGETESTVPFGYDFSKPVGKLELALEEIRKLLESGEMPGDGPGRSGLSGSTPKGLPEVWVAAQGGPRSLGLAGRYGDGWLSLTYDLDRWKRMLETVRAAAAEAGRPCPVPGAFPVTFLGESRDAIAAVVEQTPLLKLLLLFADIDAELLRDLALELPFEMFEDFVLIGNADDIATRLAPYAEAGLEHVVLADMSSVAVAPEEAAKALAEITRLTGLLHAL